MEDAAAAGDDQDYRRQSRPAHRPQGGLLGKFPLPSQFKAGQDTDFRVPAAAPEDGARSSGPGRGGYDYEDGEEPPEDDISYARGGGRPPYGGGRWSSGGAAADAGEEDYDDSGAVPGRWGARGRGSPSSLSFSRGARGGVRGASSWEAPKRGPSRGLTHRFSAPMPDTNVRQLTC